MDEELRVYLAASEARLRERVDQVEANLSERIGFVESCLLTEFKKEISPDELRKRTHAAVLRVVDAEMEALAARVTHLKRPTS